MLTLFRSNRSELLAAVLATNLSLKPPGLLEQAQVVVNTWPTSRWLGEQFALANPSGIAANLRFPFPTSLLRQLVEALLNAHAPEGGTDPWRAQNLVWPLLDLLPGLLEDPCSAPLQQWLESRQRASLDVLDLPLWQLARAIADAIDDYGLYRPAMVEAWLADQAIGAQGKPLPGQSLWQPKLVQQLHERLGCLPFGLRARQLIRQLQEGWLPELPPQPPLRLFGLSSLAPVQVELLQALSAIRDIELYLLTPCPDLWQRQNTAPADAPLSSDWLLTVPSLEARFGRLGAEFQQLLEGSGETQLGATEDQDLFLLPGSAAIHEGRSPTLLEQLQDHLATGADISSLKAINSDRSLEFHACPGRMRQLQVVRDQILQLLAADPLLEPRDILVMTPQVEAFAPLVGAVFGDHEATGVYLPWRLTDRSQQSEAGLAQGLLQLLTLGGERVTASAFEDVVANGALLAARQLDAEDAETITQLLQQAGFRWGVDQNDRHGDPTHSLSWAIDRLVLGLIFPDTPGLALADTAPMAMPGNLEKQGRWIALLRQVLSSLQWCSRQHSVQEWVDGLREHINALFGDGGSWDWELQSIHAALSDWEAIAADNNQQLAAPVVGEVLAERLSEGSGRFGHRSGSLTISALEPMRAIPHKVVVLMGLDAGAFPRQKQRPGFHLMEQERLLGDPNSGDQDRYVLLEAVLSARQHLLVSWSCRDERTGEALEASTPVRQWLDLLPQISVREHAANPLDRRNFLPSKLWPSSSCDRRLLKVRQQLDQGVLKPVTGLAMSSTAQEVGKPSQEEESLSAWEDLQAWLKAPQKHWLEQLGLRPRESERSLLDLENLSLDERLRSALLRRELEAKQNDNGELSDPSWVTLEHGRGTLPALSAGALEARLLDLRWSSLEHCLQQLGCEHTEAVRVGTLEAEVPKRGDQLVLIHTAKPRSAQRLELWLQLLLTTAAGVSPHAAVLVGRDGHQFRVLERIRPPSPEEARGILSQLQQWRADYQCKCWPLPPDTGWAFAAGEARGKGWSKARAAWEGNLMVRGEREDAVQQVCFGSDMSLDDLLTDTNQELALSLYAPLLTHHQEVKG